MIRCIDTANKFHRYQVIKSLKTSDSQNALTLIAVCKNIRRSINYIEKYAVAEEPILLSGETGTGKELWARAIHLKSYRAKKLFLVVNCAQYQNNELLVSELFGHKKGCFTDAMWDRKGAFEEADGNDSLLNRGLPICIKK